MYDDLRDFDFGLSPTRPLPKQDQSLILLTAERFCRAKAAVDLWATDAKKCVEYFEGKQWSAADLQKLRSEGRPELTINKIKPLLQLVMGYHANNRTDINYDPSTTGGGDASTAECLDALSKQTSIISELPFVDCEVFLDGSLTGRGYYDGRMKYEDNILGNFKWRAKDPFSVYPDPDGESYDLNEGAFVFTTKLISPDEVKHCYGQQVLDLVGPYYQGNMLGTLPDYGMTDEITPARKFGLEGDPDGWLAYGGYFNDWVDPYRKTVRLVDMEHWVRCHRWFFIDLETGSIDPVPEDWTRVQVQRAIDYAQARGRPTILQKRPTKRLRWTQLIGNVVAYDSWSPYESVTTVPFFPYFRRGITRGLVHDLISPQDEINKRRSSRMNIVSRTANGGWIYEKHSLDPQQATNLRLYGAKPGIHIAYNSHEGKYEKPQQISPPTPPEGMRQLELDAENDLKEISGINEAAMGQVDKVVSGRNLEARTTQALVGLETVMVNMTRTKAMQGRKQLEVYQEFYTQERIVRIKGEGDTPIEKVINQRSADTIVNDITVGTYDVSVNTVPLAKSFLDAQFEEILRLRTEAQIPIPDGFLIRASSLPGKEELVAATEAARQQQEALAATQGMGPGGPAPGGPGPGGSRVGPDGGSLPNSPPAQQGGAVIPMRR